MTKRLSLTAGLSASLSPFNAPGPHAVQEEEPDLTDAHGLIDAWLEAQRDSDPLPGLSTGIVVDQELAWSRAYGLANPAEGVAALWRVRTSARRP